jgi:tRNA(adenine34) deaminase
MPDEMTRIVDEQWMCHAIDLARQAESLGEVPVGAVVVMDDQCVGRGWNQPIATHDPTAHAEIMAMWEASAQMGTYRLTGSTLYVTLEPCVMCMGAILHARISRLVFGATDPKRGAVCSALSLSHADFSNHHVEWRGGVLATECSQQLTAFFKQRR